MSKMRLQMMVEELMSGKILVELLDKEVEEVAMEVWQLFGERVMKLYSFTTMCSSLGREEQVRGLKGWEEVEVA